VDVHLTLNSYFNSLKWGFSQQETLSKCFYTWFAFSFAICLLWFWTYGDVFYMECHDINIFHECSVPFYTWNVITYTFFTPRIPIAIAHFLVHKNKCNANIFLSTHEQHGKCTQYNYNNMYILYTSSMYDYQCLYHWLPSYTHFQCDCWMHFSPMKVLCLLLTCMIWCNTNSTNRIWDDILQCCNIQWYSENASICSQLLFCIRTQSPVLWIAKEVLQALHCAHNLI
jgi:hypothetical protein